jgi:hypothetical protein
MNNELFQSLLTLIRPRIEEENTFMRDAVGADVRLALTICSSSPVALISNRGVIPQSDSATYRDCNLIRDTSPHTLQSAYDTWLYCTHRNLYQRVWGPLDDYTGLTLTGSMGDVSQIALRMRSTVLPSLARGFVTVLMLLVVV